MDVNESTNTGSSLEQADGYYGDEDPSSEEIDLSFLDEE